MSNNNLRRINENSLKKLLGLYDNNTYSEELEKTTNKLIERYIIDKKRNKENIKDNLFKNLLLKPIPVLISSGVFLILVIFFVNIFFNTNLNNDLFLYNNNDIKSKKVIITKNTKIISKSNMDIRIQSDNYIFLLKDKSELSIIKKKNFLSNHYDNFYLKNGILYVNADNLEKNKKLSIKTDFGLIEITGTKFELDVNEERLIVRCFEGKIILISGYIKNENDTKPGKKYIVSGEMVIIDKEKIENKINDTTNDINLNRDTVIILQDDMTTDSNMKKSNQINNKILQDEEKNKLLPEKEIDKKKIKLLSQTKVENKNYKNIFLSENFTCLLTVEKNLLVFDKNNNFIKNIELPLDSDNISLFKDKLIFYQPPGKINIYLLPEFISLFIIDSGPVAFGKPVINDKYLVSASTDHFFYLYDYVNKKLLTKINFDAGFYCTPVISNDTVFISNISKNIISYSTKENIINWKYQAEERLTSEEPVISENKSEICFFTENSRGLVLNSKTGKFLFDFKFNKEIAPVFLKNNIIVFNKNIFVYDVKGSIIKENKINEKILKLISMNNNLYIIKNTNIEKYDENFDLIDEIKILNPKLVTTNNNKLILIDEKNNLMKFEL